MQYDGWLETLLHARFPKHELVIRNLGFSGDEIATRLRSKNFGTPDEWLSGDGRADRRLPGEPLRGHQHQGRRHLRVLRLQRVVRRAGRAGRVQEGPRRLDHAHARAEVQRQVGAARSCCSRRSRTRTSAIPTCPTARENNQRLALYTQAMAEVAKAHSVHVRRPVRAERAAVRRRRKAPLTINGVHLNSEGNRRIAEVIDRALFGAPPATRSRTSTQAAAGRRRQELLLVQPLPRDRRLFDLRRPGVPDVRPRQSAQRQRGRSRRRPPRRTSCRPTTRCCSASSTILDVMTANRDRRIWAVARGSDRRRSTTRHAAVHRRADQRAGQGPGRHAHLPRRRGGDPEDDGRQGPEGQALRVGEGVPRAGQPGADGVRHARAGCGSRPGRTTRTGSRRRRWTTSC